MEKPKDKQKQTTNAPPPITPITPGAATTTPDQKTMSNRDYREQRGYGPDAIKKKKA